MANEIIKVLDALCEKFGIVVDWTGTNIMPYVETIGIHMVSYYLWRNIIFTIIFGIILLSSLIFGIYLFKHTEYGVEYRTRWNEQIKDDGNRECMWIFTVIIFIISTFIFICCLLSTIKCITFPELVIFNEVKDLLNTIQ